MVALSQTAALSSGHSMPLFALGTYQLPPSTIKASIFAFLQAGGRHIDTAQFYDNEQAVGQAIREAVGQGLVEREDIFITTKVYRGFDELNELEGNVTESLERLDLGYVDLFLIHSPLMEKTQRLKTWRNLCLIAERDGGEGVVRSVGVSNFGIRHLRELKVAGLPSPAVNQIELHPHLPQSEIVNYCRLKNILVQAYCPLMRGPEGKQSLGEGAFWAGQKGYGWDHDGLKEVAQKHAVSVPQVLLRWSLHSGFSPVVKSASPKRVTENFDVQRFSLDEEDLRLIGEMSLEGREAEGRIALEWNPTDCD